MAYEFGDTILKTNNVSLTLDRKLILKDINVDVRDIVLDGDTKSSIIALMAPSGTGKTQLLKILAGINKPTTGDVLIGDFEKGKSHQVKIGDVGMVYQSYPLFEHRTVWSNLEMVFHKNEPKVQKKEKIEYYLNRFKLIEHKDKYPVQLSGGMRQRISILQQLICSDFFLGFDEPFSGLDPLMIKEVSEMIKEVTVKEKHTIIFSSHDIYSSLAIADMVWLLGRDYETNKENNDKIAIPGARIKYKQNLLDLGLTGEGNTNKLEFAKLVEEIKNLFGDL